MGPTHEHRYWPIDSFPKGLKVSDLVFNNIVSDCIEDETPAEATQCAYNQLKLAWDVQQINLDK